MKKSMFITLFIVLALVQICSAATINVPFEQATIQAGIDAALAGDTVLVGDGTFTGDGNRDISFEGKDVVVMSENGALTTILDLEGSSGEPHRAFSFTDGESSSAKLIGFTMKNGYGPFENDDNKGGAIYINSSSPTIKNCKFINNTGRRNGGAISGWNSFPLIENCEFLENYAIHGAAVYFNGSAKADGIAEFIDCRFNYNVGLALGESYGGAVLVQHLGMNVDFQGCSFNGNSAEIGGAIIGWGDVTLDFTNCTIVNNTCRYPGYGSAILVYDEAVLNFTNTLIAFNTGGEPVACTALPVLSFSCTNIYGHTDGDWSGCIAGLDGANDNFSADPLLCRIFQDELTVNSGSPCLPENNACGILVGAYGEGCTPPDGQTVYYVYQDGSGDAATIQEALDKADNGDTVYVGPGEYSGFGNRDLKFYGKEVLLQSLNGSEDTYIYCGGNTATPHRGFRIAYNETRNTIIDGFTIMNGYGPFEKDDNKGGAIYINSSSPTIRNCNFTNNTGRRNGGAISGWDSHPLVDNCSFLENYAIHGAAVYFNGSAKSADAADFVNCSFDYNSGLASSESYGGAILVQHLGMTVNFENCSFNSNSAEFGGAVVGWGDVYLNFLNCTIVNNTCRYMGYGSAFFIYGNPVVTFHNTIIAFNNNGEPFYCEDLPEIGIFCSDIYGNENGDWVGCIAGLETSNDNFSADPLFCNLNTNELNVNEGSPCLPENSTCGALVGAFGGDCIPPDEITVYYVYNDGSGDAATIQAALDLASNGDTVFVGPGTYTGQGNRDLKYYGKEILLKSIEGAANTIIDCQGSEFEPHRGFRIAYNESRNTIIDGLTVSNGFGPYEKDDFKGGAIYINSASPTVKNCVFTNNTGRRNGGAVSAWNSFPLFDKCEFTANYAIHGASIYFNGSAKSASTAEFFDCDFVDNIGLPMSESYGGAILVQHLGMTVNFERCSFVGNSAELGGAVVAWGDVLLNFANCTFADNTCNYAGAGSAFFIYLNAEVNFTNTIIAFNNGGEPFYCDGEPNLGFACCDIYGNSGGDWSGCIAGQDEDSGNFSADPLFCDLDNKDITISASSPCNALQNSCNVLIGVRDIGCGQYVCGDATGDESVTISDAVFIINYIFIGGAAPDPYLSGDTNCDYKINVTDAVYIIRYVFSGGNEPCDLDGDGIPDC